MILNFFVDLYLYFSSIIGTMFCSIQKDMIDHVRGKLFSATLDGCDSCSSDSISSDFSVATFEDILYLLPEIYCFTSLVLLLGIVSVCEFQQPKISKNLRVVQLTFYIMLMFSLILFMFYNDLGIYRDILGGFLRQVPYFTQLKMGIVFLLLLYFIYLKDYIFLNRIRSFEFVSLIAFSAVSSLILLISNHFIMIYLSIELLSIPLYIVCTLKNKEASRSISAGVTYFLLGGISSSLLVFGMCLIYGSTGILNLDDLYKYLVFEDQFFIMDNGFLIFGMILLTCGLFFKLTIVPFHSWAARIYEDSPSGLTAYIAIFSKVIIIVLFIKLYYLIFIGGFAQGFVWIFYLFGLLSMVVGIYGALFEPATKRFLAYSSISHMGLVICALGTNTQMAPQAILLYIIIYSTILLGLFSIVSLDVNLRTFIVNFSQIVKVNPALGYSTLVLLFSLAGIPPLAGFWGKLFLYKTFIDNGLYLIALIIVVLSVISTFYYLRLIKIISFERSSEMIITKLIVPKGTATVISFCVWFNLLFIFYPDPIYALCILLTKLI